MRRLEMSSLVSIIIPCYNAEEYVLRCAQSIKNQTYTQFEAIFVDDGSTDDTAHILDVICSTERRFNIIHQENQGVSSARNTGLKFARGEYIAFVDADDWVSSNWLMILVNGFDKEVDIVGCNLIYRTEYSSEELETDDSYYDIRGTNSILEYLFKHPSTKNNGLIGRAFVWNKLYIKGIIDKYNVWFDETTSIGEDYKFNYEYMKHCNIARFSKSSEYNYFQNANSAMAFIREKKTFKPDIISWCDVFRIIYDETVELYPEIAKCCEAISIRLYIRALYGMICTKYENTNFEEQAVKFIKNHYNFKYTYDMDGSIKYSLSAFVIKISYSIWKKFINLTSNRLERTE